MGALGIRVGVGGRARGHLPRRDGGVVGVEVMRGDARVMLRCEVEAMQQ